MKTISINLRKMGADLVERHDGLLVRHSKLKAAVLEGFGDHRIVMASVIASLFAQGVSTLHGADCVSVSYPGFFDDIKKLGSRIEVLS